MFRRFGKAGRVVGAAVLSIMMMMGGAGETGAAEARRGGILTVGVEYDFGGFDALKGWASGPSGACAINVIEERLFDMDEKGELVPVLGVEAALSGDSLAWTIKLRRGVSFHDGAPFNADAVVHHWSRILNPENRYRHRMFIQPIQSVEKIDDYTVRFNLAHPWAPFKVVISSVLGFSSYIPSPKAVDAGTQNRAPSGTGPYMFKAWAPDNHFIVVRNPDYWKKEAPRLDQIVFRPLPDHQTRLAGLKAGEVDMIWTDRGSHIQAAKTDKNLVTHAKEDNGAEILLLNVARPPLDDPRVRRALAHAWNQALYIRMIYKDTIPMIRHPYTSAAPCGDAGYRDYDAAEAARLIREYGKPVVVEYIHTKSLRGQQGGEIMQQLFKKIGVTVNLTGLEVGAMIKKVFTRDYQLASWRISSGADQGIWLHGQLHSKSPYNFSNYANPEMDELLVTQGKTTDPKERAALFCKIAELINRDAPIIYRGGRKYHVLAAPHVKGIPPLQDGAVLLSDAWLE